MRSLEILLEIGKIDLDDEKKELLAEKKNNNYVSIYFEDES